MLEDFKFKRIAYYKGGYIISSRFTEIELSTLSFMGKIELKIESVPTLQGKVKKPFKGATGASNSDKT